MRDNISNIKACLNYLSSISAHTSNSNCTNAPITDWQLLKFGPNCFSEKELKLLSFADNDRSILSIHHIMALAEYMQIWIDAIKLPIFVSHCVNSNSPVTLGTKLRRSKLHFMIRLWFYIYVRVGESIEIICMGGFARRVQKGARNSHYISNKKNITC